MQGVIFQIKISKHNLFLKITILLINITRRRKRKEKANKDEVNQKMLIYMIRH